VNQITTRSPGSVTQNDPLHALAERADALAHAYNAAWRGVLDGYRFCNLYEIDRQQEGIETLELDDRALRAIADELHKACAPATAREIGEAVTLLVGAFPTANPPDGAVFVRLLIEDVRAAAPSKIALELAFRHLRRSQKWLPAICEVLQALEGEERTWQRRLRMADQLPEMRAKALAMLAEDRQRIQAEEAKLDRERAERAAAAKASGEITFP
jgi:hypothetical protein